MKISRINKKLIKMKQLGNNEIIWHKGKNKNNYKDVQTCIITIFDII